MGRHSSANQAPAVLAQDVITDGLDVLLHRDVEDVGRHLDTVRRDKARRLVDSVGSQIGEGDVASLLGQARGRGAP